MRRRTRLRAFIVVTHIINLIYSNMSAQARQAAIAVPIVCTETPALTQPAGYSPNTTFVSVKFRPRKYKSAVRAAGRVKLFFLQPSRIIYLFNLNNILIFVSF